MRIALATPRAGGVAASLASSLPNGALVRQVMSIGTRFVNLSSSDTHVSNDSGATWETHAGALPGVFTTHGAAGNGVFVTVYGANAYRSVDGITWTAHDMPEPGSATWSFVGFGNGLFVVAVTNTNRAYTSPDGITWTLRTLPSSGSWREVVWSGNTFLFIPGPTAGTAAATSPDGVTWTARTLPAAVASTALPRLFGGGNSFFFLTATTTCYYSTDGISWTTRAIPGIEDTGYGAWNGTTWIISEDASDKLHTTTDGGASWTTRTLPVAGEELYVYQHGATTYVFTAGFGPIYTTTDAGANFTQLTYAGTADIITATDMGGTIVALADAGGGEALMLRSINSGATWTEEQRLPYAGTQFGNASWSYLAWDGATTLIAAPNGWSGKVARSTDSGATWTVSTLTGMTFNDYTNGCVWTGSVFFIGMQTTSRNYSSATGAVWTMRTTTPSMSNKTTYLGGNGSVVVGGNGGVVATLDAGVSWTAVDTNRRLLGFDGERFVARISSFSPSTVASTDGATWAAHSGYESTDIIDIAPYADGVMARSEIVVGPELQLQISVSTIVNPPNFSAVLNATVDTLFALDDVPAFFGDGQLWPLTLTPSSWTELTLAGGSTEGYVSQPFWTGRNIIVPDDDGIYARSVEDGAWTRGTIAGGANSFTCGAYGNGVACMLGYTGGDLYAFLSTDHGATWVQGGLVTATGYSESMVWDAMHGMFVASEYGDLIVYTSPDGLVWTQRALPVEASTLRMGVNGTIIGYLQYTTTNSYVTSNDGGLTWTARTLPVTATLGGLAANNECVVFSTYGEAVVLRSVDNINWTQHTCPIRDWIGTAWNGRYFCSIGEYTDDCAISTDGRTWALGDFLPKSGAAWFAITTDGVRFYAFPYGDALFGAVSGYSLNRVFWTELTGCTET